MKGFLCPVCHGTGLKDETIAPCRNCKGVGWMPERDFEKKYDDDFIRKPTFWQRINVFRRTH